MGKLKNFIRKSNSEIVSYLLKFGFKYDTFICGGNYGYQRGFSVDGGFYYTYIHCDLENKRLNVYKEDGCGGEVASYECDIPKNLIENDNVDKFVEWLDEKTDRFL